MEFLYSARNNKGLVVKGLVQAGNRSEAMSLIEEKGYLVLTIEERKRRYDVRITLFEKITVKDLVAFYRALSMMVSADIPIVQATRMVASQTQNLKLRKILSEIYTNVNEGMKFSDALTKHREIFGDFYIHMIRSGEASGKFDEVLEYLADQQEKDYEFRTKIKGAMTYPIFILSAMFVMTMAMLIFVIPRLTQMLLESGIELPLTTRFLIFISDITKNFWYLIVGALVILIGGGRLFIKRSEAGKKFWGRVLLRIPKIGDSLVKKTYLVRLTKSLSTLLIGGVPLVEAIDITSSVVSNYHYKHLLKETSDAVKDGNTIASVFSLYPDYLPDMLIQMTAIGEQTGRIDRVFEKIGNFYTKEVDYQVANISKMIEPVLMLVIGVMVGFLVISIMLPMFKASQAVG